LLDGILSGFGSHSGLLLIDRSLRSNCLLTTELVDASQSIPLESQTETQRCCAGNKIVEDLLGSGANFDSQLEKAAPRKSVGLWLRLY
jgi:hypothetical protein